MKKLLISLLFLPTIAFANELVLFQAMCLDRETMDKVLSDNKEEPFVTGVGHRVSEGDKVYHPTVIFMNPKTGSWTLVEITSENKYCITAVGSKMLPYIENNKKVERIR